VHLEKLHLSNFRNYENITFEFSEEVNCIVGDNGSGKTNLLDAIYFLALTKSSIQSQDVLSIRHEEDFMMIEGLFVHLKRELITCSMQRGQRKSILHDKKVYERVNDHIGKYPVVLIAPDDTDLIRDSGETRRRLFDGMIAQINAEYLTDYQLYNRILDQRNGLLKQFAEQNYFDGPLLDVYSGQLLEKAVKINRSRSEFLEGFLPLFKKHYAYLSEDREEVEISYESEVSAENFPAVFRNTQATDLAAQRTTKGIHKDDYGFQLSGYAVKKFGSQGQKKSFIMAIRLAQFEILEQIKGVKPLLLLDDIFDKLDENRIAKLLQNIDDSSFGQVFITDARPERTRKLLENIRREVKYIVPQGK
jgi:DNA replication and repair protein RecF